MSQRLWELCSRFMLVLTLSGGCSSSDTGMQDASSTDLAAPSSDMYGLDMPAGTKDMGATDMRPGGPDGMLPPSNDSLPIGAISFFNRAVCPSGWEVFRGAVGRTVVPVNSVGAEIGDGVPSGAPLGDVENRKHSHAMGATLTLKAVNYLGIPGEFNHSLASADAAPVSIAGEPAGAGLPYIQLLICRKIAPPAVTPKPISTGTLMFFAASACPSGWSQPTTTQGRFLVGLPDKGTAGRSFGGPPLSAGPPSGPIKAEIRTHHHMVSGQIKTAPHGISLGSGGAAGGYAKDDTYPYQENSQEESAGMPYILLLQCQKM